MPPNPTKTEPPDTVTFEGAMKRLENIVTEMESAQMPLDELVDRYEEGTKLIDVCQKKLLAAEQRIEMVTRKAAEPTVLLPLPKNPPEKTPNSDASLF